MKRLTCPTVITEQQYQNAFYAVTTDYGDLFLLWNDSQNILWLGRSESYWKDYNPMQNENCEVVNVDVPDDNGGYDEKECFVCAAMNCFNSLNLEELAQGYIVFE